jgi:hypothetical protein
MPGRVRSLEPVGGEFQPQIAIGYPGGGAYLASGFAFIFVLNPFQAANVVNCFFGCLPRCEKPAIVVMAGFFGHFAHKRSCNGATTPYHRNKKSRCRISHSSLRKLPTTALSGGVIGNYRHFLSGAAAGIFPEAIHLHDSRPIGSPEH